VAAAAALHPLDVGVGLKLVGRHGIHGDPGQSMLAGCVLIVLLGVAFLAGLFGRHGDLGHVIGALMRFAVAAGAVDTTAAFAHFACQEILDDVRGDLLVTGNAIALGGQGRQGEHEHECQCPANFFETVRHVIPPWNVETGDHVNHMPKRRCLIQVKKGVLTSGLCTMKQE